MKNGQLTVEAIEEWQVGYRHECSENILVSTTHKRMKKIKIIMFSSETHSNNSIENRECKHSLDFQDMSRHYSF